MKIALDIGHLGKVNKPMDRGAVFEGTRETDFVLIYALCASQHLEKAGHCVYLLTYADYSKRKQFCKDINIELHMQLHLNSSLPPGNYALIEYREANEKKM